MTDHLCPRHAATFQVDVGEQLAAAVPDPAGRGQWRRRGRVNRVRAPSPFFLFLFLFLLFFCPRAPLARFPSSAALA